METKDITTVLDGLEILLIEHLKSDLKSLYGKEIGNQGAKNILAKIGTRIMFGNDLGKEQVDEIFVK